MTMYWEIVQCVFQLLFGMCSVLLGGILHQKKKKRERVKHYPSLQYFKLRVHVNSWMNKKQENGKTRMEDVFFRGV